MGLRDAVAEDQVIRALRGTWGELILTMVEKMLVDDLGRGVLVILVPDAGWRVQLSDAVPWGTMEIIEA